MGNRDIRVINQARLIEDSRRSSKLNPVQKKIFQEAVNRIAHSKLISEKGKIKRIKKLEKYLENLGNGITSFTIKKGLFKKETNLIKTPKDLLKKVKQEKY